MRTSFEEIQEKEEERQVPTKEKNTKTLQ